MKITLPLAKLNAALVMAGKDDLRKCLNGVLVEVTPDKVLLVATNGAALIAIKSSAARDNPEPAQFIIPRYLVEQAAKSFDKKHAVDVELTEDGLLKLSQYGGIVGGKPVEGMFPPWRRIVPSGKAVVASAPHVDPTYVTLFAKVAKELGHKNAVISLISTREDEGSALRVDMGLPTVTGVLLPLRRLPTSTWDSDKPDWV